MKDFFILEEVGNHIVYAGDGRYLVVTDKKAAQILVAALNNMILIADADRGFDRRVVAETFLDEVLDLTR
jgi:hypothetical protein